MQLLTRSPAAEAAPRYLAQFPTIVSDLRPQIRAGPSIRCLFQHFQPTEEVPRHKFYRLPVSAWQTFLMQLGESNVRGWLATVSICSCCCAITLG